VLSLPVIPTGLPVFDNELHFPHVTAGAESETSILIVNPSLTQTPMRGTLEFFDEEGDALEIELLEEGRVSSVPFEIGGGSSKTFSTRSGGVQVTATARAQFEEGFGNGLLTFSVPGAGMGASGTGIHMQSFIAPASRSNSNEVSTLLVVQNIGSPKSVTVNLRNNDGSRVQGGEITLQLPINGFISRTVQDLFPDANTTEFEGTLAVEASKSAVAALVFRIDSIQNEVLNVSVTPLN